MTGSVLTVGTTVTKITLDTGATTNASGDLSTNQNMLPSNGSAKPVKATSTDSIATLSTHSRKESADSMIIMVDEPQSERDTIPEI